MLLIFVRITCVRIDKLPAVMPLDELLPHREMSILHCHYAQLTLHIGRPIHSPPLLVGVDVLEPTNDQGCKPLQSPILKGRELESLIMISTNERKRTIYDLRLFILIP